METEMEKQIQMFNNGNINLSVKMINNEIFFDAEQVAIGLGISLEKWGKTYVRWERVRKYLNSPQVEKGDYINESQFYKLAIKANNDVAEKFQDWVTSEVLPAIRKHGAYMTEQKIEEALLNPDTLITLAKQLKAEKEQRLLAQKQVEEMTPKAVFHDAVASAENTMLVRDVAHFLRQNGVDIGGTRFFVWLRLNGFLTKNNQPTQLSLERGYFKVKETVVHTNHGFQTKTTPKITGRGQTFFLKKMLKEQEEKRAMGL